MKLRLTSLSFLTLLTLAFAATPAAVGDSDPYFQAPSDIALYSNGPAHPNDPNAWQFNAGVVMSSSFYIGASSEVTGFSFTAWLYPGDVLQTADVSVTSQPNGGIVYFDSTVNFTLSNGGGWQSSIPKCGGGPCDVYTATAEFAGIALGTGTYYLNMQNGVTAAGNPVFWDENDGVGCTGWLGSGTPCPATAFQGGTLLSGVSLDQDIFGTTSQTTPEPSSFLLLGSAIIGVGGMLHRRRIP